jgi:predicted MPP superfamily phosphohydrolase
MFFVFMGVLLLLDLLWWRLADRRLRHLRHSALWRVMLGAFVVCMIGGLALSFARIGAMRIPDSPLPMLLVAPTMVWHVLIIPATWLAIGINQLRRLAGRGLLYVARRPLPASADATAISRRRLLGAATVALPPLVLAGGVGAVQIQMGRCRVRDVEIPLRSLPRSLDGVTIAHVTDVHVGRFMGRPALAHIADMVRRLHADLILLTGDLIDYASADLPRAMDFVTRLRGRAQPIMCFGNHDLFDSPFSFEDAARKTDVPLLVNRWKTLTVRGVPVDIAGLQWTGADDELAAAVATLCRQGEPAARLADGRLPILLSHHPHGFDPAAAAGFPLTLAGHTHGGQVMLGTNIGPASLIHRYISGLYRKNDAALMVSNGVGNWFPLRINAPAEIVHITLKRGGDGA